MEQSDYVCRVCLAEGAWNIFSNNVIKDDMCTVASINCIREKLQYVTELQLHENDGLPDRICELCIIQLNVAYRFKQLAIESDQRLRQKLVSSVISPTAENALNNDDHTPAETAVPEIVVPKQEESTYEITVEPIAVSEELSIDTCTASSETIVSQELNRIPAMVYLQNDISNPAEDEAYLKDIMKQEVISMLWPIGNETHTDEQNASPPTTIPSVQAKVKQASAKSHQKRKRSESETRPHRKENGPQQEQIVKKKAKKSKPRSTAPSTGIENRNSTGAPKLKMKPSKATLRKRRLQKVLNSLRIDMMFNPTADRHGLLAPETAPNTVAPGQKMPMKRRNSICVSSFAPWL